MNQVISMYLPIYFASELRSNCTFTGHTMLSNDEIMSDQSLNSGIFFLSLSLTITHQLGFI